MAADALETPTIDPATISNAIDIVENFFDTLTSTKFTQQPQIYVTSMRRFYLFDCKISGRKSLYAGEITVNIRKITVAALGL